jgi:hypothetical protein
MSLLLRLLRHGRVPILLLRGSRLRTARVLPGAAQGIALCQLLWL